MAKKYSKEQVEEAVKKSNNYSEVFKNLGILLNGGSFPWLKAMIQDYQIAVDHFYTKSRAPKEIRIDFNDGPTKTRIRAKVLRDILIHSKEEICNECGLSEWRGSKLRLDIDHIDGNCLNNNTDNLQFICPNCHRAKTINIENQNTEEYLRKSKNLTKICECGKYISSKSKTCMSCWSRKPKIDWPLNERLQEMVWESPLTDLAKILGVTDNAIKKHCQKSKIILPPQNYWTNFNLQNFEICKELKDRAEQQGFRENKSKANYPTDDILQEEVWKKSLTQIGKDFGVTRKAVFEQMRKRNLIIPSLQYRAYIQAGNLEKAQLVRKKLEDGSRASESHRIQ